MAQTAHLGNAFRMEELSSAALPMKDSCQAVLTVGACAGKNGVTWF